MLYLCLFTRYEHNQACCIRSIYKVASISRRSIFALARLWLSSVHTSCNELSINFVVIVQIYVCQTYYYHSKRLGGSGRPSILTSLQTNKDPIALHYTMLLQHHVLKLQQDSIIMMTMLKMRLFDLIIYSFTSRSRIFHFDIWRRHQYQ
jgi:hypothetical protein